MDCSGNKVLLNNLPTFSQLIFNIQASFKEETHIFLTSFYKTSGCQKVSPATRRSEP